MNIQSIAYVNAALTGTDPVTSDVVHLDHVGAASVQLCANVGSGNLAGQWKIEGSNDYVDSGSYGKDRFAGNWVDLDDNDTVDIPATTGSAQVLLVRLGVIDFLYLRITFTPTSGTGPIKAIVGGKNVG